MKTQNKLHTIAHYLQSSSPKKIVYEKKGNRKRAFSNKTCVTKQSQSLPFIANRASHFNKYYISPNDRFKSKNSNPKMDRLGLKNSQYIYNNLHNWQFWNWIHPLDYYAIKPAHSDLSNKINRQKLQQFQDHLQRKKHRDIRIPSIVHQVLYKT